MELTSVSALTPHHQRSLEKGPQALGSCVLGGVQRITGPTPTHRKKAFSFRTLRDSISVSREPRTGEARDEEDGERWTKAWPAANCGRQCARLLPTCPQPVTADENPDVGTVIHLWGLNPGDVLTSLELPGYEAGPRGSVLFSKISHSSSPGPLMASC